MTAEPELRSFCALRGRKRTATRRGHAARHGAGGTYGRRTRPAGVRRGAARAVCGPLASVTRRHARWDARPPFRVAVGSRPGRARSNRSPRREAAGGGPIRRRSRPEQTGLAGLTWLRPPVEGTEVPQVRFADAGRTRGARAAPAPAGPGGTHAPAAPAHHPARPSESIHAWSQLFFIPSTSCAISFVFVSSPPRNMTGVRAASHRALNPRTTPRRVFVHEQIHAAQRHRAAARCRGRAVQRGLLRQRRGVGGRQGQDHA